MSQKQSIKVTVDMPLDVHARLVASAKNDRRSLAQQTLFLLEQATIGVEPHLRAVPETKTGAVAA